MQQEGPYAGTSADSASLGPMSPISFPPRKGWGVLRCTNWSLNVILIISSSSISYLAPTWLPVFFENQPCRWDSFPMVFKFQSIWDHNSLPSSQPTDQPQNETQTARCVSVSVWGSQFSVPLGRMNAHSGKCSTWNNCVSNLKILLVQTLTRSFFLTHPNFY